VTSGEATPDTAAGSPVLAEPADTFDVALTGRADELELADGRRLLMHAARWHHGDAGDRRLLERCHGTTIDLGCGPGRLVEALLARGVPALGVDLSRHAITRCRGRGVPALRRDVFAGLPGEGHWQHVLLADGNIGIGGDPVRLLRRAEALLDTGGSVVVEAAGPKTGLWRGGARLRDEHRAVGPWFPWALVGMDAIAAVGRLAGLSVVGAARHRPGRYFAHLERG
jgi:SAM-dependent methyltransferase